MIAVPARQNSEERSHEETLHQERCACGVAWDLAKYIYKLKNAEKASFHFPIEATDNAGAHFEKKNRGTGIRG